MVFLISVSCTELGLLGPLDHFEKKYKNNKELRVDQAWSTFFYKVAIKDRKIKELKVDQGVEGAWSTFLRCKK